ncbi:hypothetical protein CAP35_03205 [Chitinophagaceae bacterium IBVUCB1]|nr:hypothetical protein CAP35_03205 [Chitinophagaceae bacterium IBVUCB1]
MQAQWGIELSGTVSEQEIIEKLSLQIGVIAEKGADVFFQLMYRLDIPEKLLLKAMADKEAAIEIAKLIYNRQLQKIRSRAFYKGKHETDEDIIW